MFHSERRARTFGLVLALALALASPRAMAGDELGRTISPEDTARARAEFVTATDHVKNARWGEALASFERSAEIRPHALTTFNIGACERALGRYSRARATLKKALAMNDAATKKELAASFVKDANTWMASIDQMLVRAKISVAPADATLLVDGSPPPPGSFEGGKGEFELDPGTHVFSVSRAGFTSAVVTKTFTPGTTPDVDLDMQSLPATLRIAADRAGAVVSVDDMDVGVAPVQLVRPAGTYAIAVRKQGFVPYQSSVKVGPGEEPSIQATLPPEVTPVTKKVWFWSAITVAVAGAAVGTFFLTRPDPERPAPNGGALGWVVTVPASR